MRGWLAIKVNLHLEKRQRGHTENYAVGGHGMASLPLSLSCPLCASLSLSRSLAH